MKELKTVRWYATELGTETLNIIYRKEKSEAYRS